MLHEGFFTLKGKDEVLSIFFCLKRSRHIAHLPLIGTQPHLARQMKIPAAHKFFGPGKNCSGIFDGPQHFTAHEFKALDRKRLFCRSTPGSGDVIVKLFKFGGGVDLAPDFKVVGEFDQGAKRGINDVADDFFAPEFFKFIEKLLHFRCTCSEHQAIVLIKKLVKIGIKIPCDLGKGVIVEVVEDLKVGFTFKKHTVDIFFDMLQIKSCLPVHHGGDPLHLSLAHVFPGIGPDGDLAAGFLIPFFQQFNIVSPVFRLSHAFDSQLYRHIIRYVTLRQTIQTTVSHLGHDSVELIFFQPAGEIGGMFPEKVADSLSGLGIILIHPRSGSDFCTFGAAAPIKPVLRHN